MKNILVISAIAIGALGAVKPLPSKAISYMDELRHHEDYLNGQRTWNKEARKMFKNRDKYLRKKAHGIRKARAGHVAWTGADASLFELELQMHQTGFTTKNPSWGVHEHAAGSARRIK